MYLLFEAHALLLVNANMYLFKNLKLDLFMRNSQIYSITKVSLLSTTILLDRYLLKKQVPDFTIIQRHFPLRSADSIRNHWAVLKKKKSYLHNKVRPAAKAVNQ